MDKGISEAAGHYGLQPRPFQQQAMEAVMKGDDVFVAVPTGSDKYNKFMLLIL